MTAALLRLSRSCDRTRWRLTGSPSKYPRSRRGAISCDIRYCAVSKVSFTGSRSPALLENPAAGASFGQNRPTVRLASP